MANPPITIGPFTNVPAPGSPIRSNWPQTISQYVADHTVWPVDVLITSAGNVDAAAAAMTDWLVGGIAVPALMTRAQVITTIAGIYDVAATDGAFEVQTRVGAVAGKIRYRTDGVINRRNTLTYVDALTGLAAGSTVNIAVMARRSLGTGVMRFDAPASCQFAVAFRP